MYKFSKKKDLDKTISQLQELKNWPENWDNYGSEKPNTVSITKAEKIITQLFNFSLNLNYDLASPHISASAEGEIVLEWWSKSSNKKLTLYIIQENIEYIKVGSDKIEEMEDGHLQEINFHEFQKMFNWLAKLV